MKKEIIAMVAMFFLALNAFSCDVCSCNANDLGLGLNGAYNSSYLMVGYGGSSFKAIADNETIDQFNFLEISGQFYLHDSLYLSLKLPYSSNKRTVNGASSSIQGFSDPFFGLAYKWLNKSFTSGLEWQSLAGVGLNIPLGKFNNDIHKAHIPESFNPGRGAFAMNFSLSSLLEFKTWSLNASYVFRHYFEKEGQYHFGDQQLLNLQVFKRVSTTTMALKPFIGYQLEDIKEDTFGHGVVSNETGAKAHSLTAGIFVRKENYLFGLTGISPIFYQSNNKFKSTGAIRAQFVYLF